MAIEWNEKFASGVTIIDTQHKKIFSICNSLQTAISQRSKWQEVNLNFMKFEQLINRHFGTEERIMKEHNFNLLDEHKKQHDGFKILLTKFEKACNTSGLTDKNKSMFDYMISKWWETHVNDWDLKLGDYLRQIK